MLLPYMFFITLYTSFTLCNSDPLESYFHIVKLEVRVYIIFATFALKQKVRVLNRTASFDVDLISIHNLLSSKKYKQYISLFNLHSSC